MPPTALSDEDLLFDLDLEVVPSDGQHDTTIHASGNGYVCTTGVSWSCRTQCGGTSCYQSCTCQTYFCAD
ncbi:hypothetical protein GCM10010412_088570 [Nonomuraea recticatena]|jgi:hypothetical protein|uniref:Lantibiotic n=1 Tax=Nonomuraea recticatena TaxID=46178 RepID=A0ABP6FMV3_9ACTN